MPADPIARVLVVDDHVEMARLLADQLTDAGYAVDVADDGTAAVALAEARLPDVVIADLRMQGLDGFDVLAAVRGLDPTIPVLIMTAFGAIDSAIEAIKRGAFHYLTKPFQLGEVLVYVERALEERRLRAANRSLKRLAEERSGLASLVGTSAPMQRLYEAIERAAATTAPVLILGESGSGKELVARALHLLGSRADRPFVAVNCTALPSTLLESELFGHVRGAYTGATASRRGLFLEADGGSLLLDEIGDMPPELQAKLLRVLEDGLVRPVGADTSRRIDVRLVAATHQPLEQHVALGRFRSDLFYRLNVVPLVVPPLRERPEDVPLLARHFLVGARRASPGAKLERFSADALAALSRYAWPGNVRELENVVRRMVVMCPDEEADAGAVGAIAPAVLGGDHGPALLGEGIRPLRQVEDDYIAWAIAHCGGNKTKAAEMLGIDASTIYRREKAGSR